MLSYTRRRFVHDSLLGLSALLAGRNANSVAAVDGAKPSAAAASSRPALPTLGAGVLQSVIYEGFRSGASFEPFEVLASNGVEWARTQVTTQSAPELDTLPVSQWRQLGWQNSYWQSPQMSAAILRKAAAAGMRLHVEILFSDGAAHAGLQVRPAGWIGLSDSELAAAIEAYSRSLASYYAASGLVIEVFELGNEIDFGFCGYNLSDIPIPAGVDPVNDPAWMYGNLWSRYVPLFNAAVRGLRSVYPNALIGLHLAGFGYSQGNIAPRGFYSAMVKAGVPFDIASLSYPYISIGMRPVPQPYFRQADFLSTFDALRALGKQIQIAEFNYPAHAAGIDVSLAPPYPCTAIGQAQFLKDFVEALAGRVDRIYYWSTDIFPGINGVGGLPADIESGGLFSSAETPRPAVASLRRAAANRLFDWAERTYPNLFPGPASSNSSGPYYFRYYPEPGNYVGVDERSNTVVLHNGRDWGFAAVGALRDVLRLAN